MKKVFQNKLFSECIFLISGIVLSLVGLYLYHQQYLCYEYTPLLFILGVVVCLGGAFLSVPTVRKKKTLFAVLTALIIAVVLIGGMFLINAIIGNGELDLIALLIPVYLTFFIITVLSLICVFRNIQQKRD